MAHITHGDVQAVFDAFGGGGGAIVRHREASSAAPDDRIGSNGAIRPFKDWDGLHLKATDWHVILIADFEGGDRSFTHADAVQIMSTVVVQFRLDGAVLSTSRTAIKRFLRPFEGLEEAYYFQEGRIMAPQDLAVGMHELECVVTADGDITFSNTIQFSIEL